MGVRDFQNFIEENCKSASCHHDLQSSKWGASMFHGSSSVVVIDSEDCLHRIYGGFYTDWTSGGSWSRMLHFLSNFFDSCKAAKMNVVLAINGSLESSKFSQFQSRQVVIRKNIGDAMNLVKRKGSPPPKIWWVPPACLRTCLRLIAYRLSIPMLTTYQDHQLDVINFCHEHHAQALLAYNTIYAISQPTRYFSLEHTKLKYSGHLDLVEFDMDSVAKTLDLHPKRFSIMAALLGNHILSELDLWSFHERLLNSKDKQLTKSSIISCVIEFVRCLESVDDLNEIAKMIFRFDEENLEKKMEMLRSSYEYYYLATKEGYSKAKKKLNKEEKYHVAGKIVENDKHSKEKLGNWPESPESSTSPSNDVLDVDGLVNGMNCLSADLLNESISSDGNSPARPSRPMGTYPGSYQEPPAKTPKLSNDVLKMARKRHQQGFMCPWVHQVLVYSHIKLELGLEDYTSPDLPGPIDLYRPLRQQVYGILFDVAKKRAAFKTSHNGQELEPITVKETFLQGSGSTATLQTVHVEASPLEPVPPGLRRLWFGTDPDVKNRRLEIFLRCMKSNTASMKNTMLVPEKFLILCSVLRYMLSNPIAPFLRRQELDAFLMTAVSPILEEPETIQKIEIPTLNTRAVHLGTLFMNGVETALFVNDTVGAPVPWMVCCPWTFFDGKLFHYKLHLIENNCPMSELCDGKIGMMMRVDHLRSAILSDLQADKIFDNPNSNIFMGMGDGHSNNNFHARQQYGANKPPFRGMGRPSRGRPIPRQPGGPLSSYGGELMVAGQVVGSWGARGRGRPISHPQAMGRGGKVILPQQSFNMTGKVKPKKKKSKRCIKEVSEQQFYGIHDKPLPSGRGCTTDVND